MLNPESGFKIVQNQTGMSLLRVYMNKFLGTVPCLPMPRLPQGGSLGLGKIQEAVSAWVKLWAGVPYYLWACCVYMSKIRSGVPKSSLHHAKILGFVPIFQCM